MHDATGVVFMLLLMGLHSANCWTVSSCKRPSDKVMSHQQWRAVVMCATDDFGSLHDSLKRAAAEKLGASLEDSMKEEDLVRFQSGARTM